MNHARSIVIADDHFAIITALTMLLEGAGHLVASASDGAAALRLVLARQPDVVILDLDMPELSGLEVAVALRKALGAATPRLIALTGNGLSDTRERCMAAGFDEVCFKPIGPEILLRLVIAPHVAHAAKPTRERRGVGWGGLAWPGYAR